MREQCGSTAPPKPGAGGSGVVGNREVHRGVKEESYKEKTA
jgi:hypothetical protein